MGGYEYLAADSERPKRIADHTNAWERLTPLSGVNGTVRERVENFARRKRIRVEALEALGTRIAHRRGGGVQLAFAGENGAGTVTAIKYRPLDGSSHDSTAEAPSTWLRPIIVGRRDSLDWLVVEGETDGARVYDLAGDHAAVLVLPAGALTFRREWAALIPRGASVALLHDADHDGDRGAEKAQQIIGGKTLRVRPPVEGGDWCDWEGDREAFLELLGAARGPSAVFSPLTDFLVHPFPKAEPLLGKRPKIYVARGSLLMTYGPDGASKTTVGIDAMAHMAAGIDWLGISVEGRCASASSRTRVRPTSSSRSSRPR